MKKTFVFLLSVFLLGCSAMQAQDHQEQSQAHESQSDHDDQHSQCGFHHDPAPGSEYDSKGTSFHHIADANVYSIGPIQIPLPVIAYAPGHGWDFFMSSKFHFDMVGHGDGHHAYNHYVLHEGSIKRIIDESFPDGEIALDGFKVKHEEKDGKEINVSYTCYNGSEYKLDSKSTADGGLFGGGNTTFYDFSLTKNVVSMFIIFGLFFFVFRRITKAYKERDGMAPKGIQSFFEPIFLFIQDEVAKPFLGKGWEKYNPFLMSLFFFILGLNLWGQIPFFGGANVTGNLAVTMVLAVFTFFVTNLSGNKNYWEHVFWMPGVPAAIKAIILTPVEILGLFIKPFTLMLRLFANITAGHIVVLSFVGLIFMFGKMGASIGGSLGGAVVSVPLTIFMLAIELLVAFIQAFVFTILAASYIGAAIEEHH